MTDAERASTLDQMRSLADVAQGQAESLTGLLTELRMLLAEEEGAGGDARD
jgi:hypothetical protein